MQTTDCLYLPSRVTPRQRTRNEPSLTGDIRPALGSAQNKTRLGSIKGLLSSEPAQFVATNTQVAGE